MTNVQPERRASKDELRVVQEELRASQEELRAVREELRAVREELRAVEVAQAGRIDAQDPAAGGWAGVQGILFESDDDAGVIRFEGDVDVLFPAAQGPSLEATRDRLMTRIHPHDRERAQRVFSRAGATDGKVDLRLLVEDERYIDIHVCRWARRGAVDLGAPAPAPAPVAGVVLVFDGWIDALLRSRSQLTTLLSRLPNGITSILDEELVFVNVYGLELTRLGLVPEDVIGRSIDELYSPESAALIRRECRRALDEDRLVSFENSFGEQTYIVNVMQIPSAGAGGRQILVLSTNITEKRRAEQALIRAKEEAERASNARRTFLASMSHELRTPLAGMLGLLDLLAGEALSREPESRAHLSELRGFVNEQERHIAELLDFSRIDANQLVLKNERFAVKDAFASFFRQAQSSLDGNVALAVVLPAEDTSFVGDPVRIRQVITNLVGNAIKYTEVGEINARICVEETGELTIEVADTGVGISAADLDRIFEIYARADDATAYAQGWGLGLVVVRRIIEQMGGTIAVESKVGEGSRFHVRLPAARVSDATAANDASDANDASVDPGRLAGLRVLVVEDNDVIRVIVGELLRRDQVETTVVATAAEAERALESAGFDAIVMDLTLPDRSGLDLIRSIRSQETAGLRTPIIALTALGYEEDRRRSLGAGADVHLTKPIAHDILRRTLLRLLEEELEAR